MVYSGVNKTSILVNNYSQRLSVNLSRSHILLQVLQAVLFTEHVLVFFCHLMWDQRIRVNLIQSVINQDMLCPCIMFVCVCQCYKVMPVCTGYILKQVSRNPLCTDSCLILEIFCDLSHKCLHLIYGILHHDSMNPLCTDSCQRLQFCHVLSYKCLYFIYDILNHDSMNPKYTDNCQRLLFCCIL